MWTRFGEGTLSPGIIGRAACHGEKRFLVKRRCNFQVVALVAFSAREKRQWKKKN
jgi:hypothetical protein